MVKVYTHESAITPISMGRPELMVHSNNLSQALEWASCVVIGPGLGDDEWAQHTFDEVMNYCQSNNMVLVIDADALNLLAKHVSSYSLSQCILTPHPGEASRLLSLSIKDIESDRFSYARQCAKRYTATCVLKGAGTLIDNGTNTWVCENGNPALAVGGSGDVLTGIIGALLAQGLDIDEAACYGVTLHAKAGDIASERDGQRGMLPSDLFPIVRELVNKVM
jgi:NAD(P)H-hydrate epimerase